MKSAFKTFLCLLTAVCMIALAGIFGAARAETDVSGFKTLSDVFAYESQNSGFDHKNYVYVFEMDGVFYRAIAELPEEVSEAIYSWDYMDPDYDKKISEAVAPLPITKIENLSVMMPAQEELDALVGMTGQQLKNDGWSISSWQLDQMEFGMYHGLFAYTVIMEGDYVPNANYDFDEDKDFAPLKVKSVTCDGIGDATSDILQNSMEDMDMTWDDDNPFEELIGDVLGDWLGEPDGTN